jgi:hypothetical protein
MMRHLKYVHGNPGNYNLLAEPNSFAHLKSERKNWKSG